MELKYRIVQINPENGDQQPIAITYSPEGAVAQVAITTNDEAATFAEEDEARATVSRVRHAFPDMQLKVTDFPDQIT